MDNFTYIWDMYLNVFFFSKRQTLLFEALLLRCSLLFKRKTQKLNVYVVFWSFTFRFLLKLFYLSTDFKLKTVNLYTTNVK